MTEEVKKTETKKSDFKRVYEYRLGSIKGEIIKGNRGFSLRVDKLWYDDKEGKWKSTNWFKPYDVGIIQVVLQELVKGYFESSKMDSDIKEEQV